MIKSRRKYIVLFHVCKNQGYFLISLLLIIPRAENATVGKENIFLFKSTINPQQNYYTVNKICYYGRNF